MRALLETKGGFLIHCTAGKDRTVLALPLFSSFSAFLVSRYLNDYLLTNQSTDLIERIRSRMSERAMDIDEVTLEVIARVRRPVLGSGSGSN